MKKNKLTPPVSIGHRKNAQYDLLCCISQYIHVDKADEAGIRHLIQAQADSLPRLTYRSVGQRKNYQDILTDLYFAAAENHFPDIVEWLIQKQVVDKNAVCISWGNSSSVLERLVETGDTYLYDRLVKWGVDENRRGSFAAPAELRRLFLPDSAEPVDWNKLYALLKEKPVSIQSFVNAVNTMPALISYTPYRNGASADKSGRSALARLMFLAIQENHPDMVAFLLKSKLVNPNVQEGLYGEETALHKAFRCRHSMITDILLTYGANPDIPNKAKKTVRQLHDEQIKILI